MKNNLEGIRVVGFESRRAQEIQALIEKHHGTYFSAPSMVEIPLEKNTAVFQFAEKLFHGAIDILILTTGVGTDLLLRVLQTKYTLDDIRQVFQKITLVARGPKPLAALGKIGIKPHVTVPEPNTWQEIVAALDNPKLIRNHRIAIQEYGIPNHELTHSLEKKGAELTLIPVYRWALPRDLRPLQTAIEEIVKGSVDVVMFLSAQQIQHVFQVACEMKKEWELRDAMQRCVIASIGPLTSEAVRQKGMHVDFEPSKSKMAIMIQELAEIGMDLLRKKKSNRTNQFKNRQK